MRYMSVVMVRLHPARDADFTDSIRLVLNAYQKSNNEQPLVVYQVVSGAQGPTYLFFSPMATMKTMDEAPLRGRAIREAMGEEDAAKMLKTSAEVTASSAESVRVKVPALEGGVGQTVPVAVALGSDSSNSLPFTLGRLPLLTGIAPKSVSMS